MIHVTVHPSQFPDRVTQGLLESLRTRQIKHKFLYDSYKQSQKWHDVHEAHSPASNDPDCVTTYERTFSAVADSFKTSRSPLHVVGLGCGGGHKDATLLKQLRLRSNRGACIPFYTAVDVSLALVIAARQRAVSLGSPTECVVCDLEAVENLEDVLHTFKTARRIITFFGMIPNSEPDLILPKLRELLSSRDTLLISANLAPGHNYFGGVKRVRPQYDNPLTADWLLTFLDDLGIERSDGRLEFSIEETSTGLLRIRADFVFERPRGIRIAEEDFCFTAKEKLRLFYSYRYTPELLKHVLEEHGLRVTEQWITPLGEEGVFRVTRLRSPATRPRSPRRRRR